MGLRSWILQRFGLTQTSVDLLAPQALTITTPKRAGLASMAIPRPWSVARLQALFMAMEDQPSVSSDLAARIARHQLSRFWLASPVDQLDKLYGGPFGDLQRLQLSGALVHQDLAVDEKQWRDQLLNRLEDPACAAERINLLLALMPYTRPRKLSVTDPLKTLPDWLLNDYCVYCEPDLVAPVGLLEPADQHNAEVEIALEPISERRGEAAMAWFRDADALATMQELIAAYAADPTNPSTCQELAVLRRVLAQLWLDVEPVQLETLFDTPVGEVTQSLINSGFGKVLLDDNDAQIRAQLGDLEIDFAQAEAPGIVLATLLFHPLENVGMQFSEDMPVWFLDMIKKLEKA